MPPELLLAALLAGPAGDRCAALARLELPGVTLAAEAQPPNACRVRGVARRWPGSEIGFEVWLPVAGWNGRYYQLGTGGFGGAIHVPSLAAEVARGNATASTDTGHTGDPFDASWATPARLADYAHRSQQVTARAADALIRAFYGRPAAWRYFAGCSNGGRQALLAAEHDPGEWDGVIAGAPAWRWTAQLGDFATIAARLHVAPLPPAKLAAIQRAALAGCPPATLTESVPADPRACRFDLATLACGPVEHDGCLTPPQVETVRLIQRAGFYPTAAAVPDGWAEWIVGPGAGQARLGAAAARHLLPLVEAERLDAAPAGLARFAARGGRLIAYMGWADPVIAPLSALDHHARVTAALGPAATSRFYRLFMVPGMLHCQGGAAPHAFGQSLPAPAARPNRAHDIRHALEAWVERGVAPTRLVANRPAPPARRTLYPVDPRDSVPAPQPISRSGS